MQLLAILVGTWMIVTGGWLMQQGWSQRNNNRTVAWIILIPGMFSIITGVMAIFNKATGATAVSIIFGIQLLLAGIALVVLGFVKRKIISLVEDKVQV